MSDDRFSSSVLNERICVQIHEFSIRYVDKPSGSVSENIEIPSPCVLIYRCPIYSALFLSISYRFRALASARSNNSFARSGLLRSKAL